MAQKFLSIKNFERYQHFKKSNPPWIKLYRSLFLDIEFMRLPLSCKYLYIGLVTLASEGCNRVPNDLHFISHRLSILPSEIDLKPLYKAGFLIASESTVYRETITKLSLRDREETETEKISPLPSLQEGKREKGKSAFPAGWKPEQAEMEQWSKHGIREPWVEFATFRDHALAIDRRCKDWPAAWRNWCRKSLRMKEERANGLYQVRG